MLREKLNVSQHPGEPRRRFFWDEYLQLYVWSDEHDRPIAFELSYDMRGQSRAFRWDPRRGTSHYRVDEGEGKPMKRASALLRADRASADPRITRDFQARSEGIDPQVAALVLEKLEEYLTTIPQ